MSKFQLNRRSLIKSGVALGAGLALPTIFTSSARAYLNEPTGDTVTLGFNVPQSGPYADEGATSCAPLNLPSNTSMVAAMAACSTPSARRFSTAPASWARRSHS
jgi:hypothetical protein